jgi:Na+-transporting NADH:ubiquinone oxidoreductase subunit NqrF
MGPADETDGWADKCEALAAQLKELQEKADERWAVAVATADSLRAELAAVEARATEAERRLIETDDMLEEQVVAGWRLACQVQAQRELGEQCIREKDGLAAQLKELQEKRSQPND